MKIEMGMQQRLEQRLVLAPQMIQSMAILQLPMIDLDRLVRDELEQNPVLEIAETGGERAENRQDTPGEPGESAKVAPDFPDFGGTPRARSDKGEKDGKMEAMQNAPAPPETLQEFLFGQFMLLDIDPSEREIGEKIIFNIDGRGYLPYRLDEIIDMGQGAERIELAERVLKMVQGLDPPGVGGRDLAEVLLLQIDRSDPQRELKERLIRFHFDDVLNNRLPKAARSLGIGMSLLKALLAGIAMLNPHPGALYSGAEPDIVRPDAVIEAAGDSCVVRIENQYLPTLRINDCYRKIIADKSADPETMAYVRGKIESAKWLIEAILQRRNTLHRVVTEIFRVQRLFLEEGVRSLRPLKMREVSDVLELHVSTVSRAVSGKYVQTDRGIFPLKLFFSGSTACGNGEDMSRTTVRMKVLEMVRKEDSSRPLSDEAISEALLKQGLDVARRTVTKYRKAQGIPSSRMRKRY